MTIRLMPKAALLCAAVVSLFLPVMANAMTATLGGPLPQPLPLLPSDNWWNLDIGSWPVDPGSSSFISFINNGGTRALHPDLGGNAPTASHPSASYGMPYGTVTGVASSDLVAVQFNYASQSDGVDHSTEASYPFYPLPPQAITQPYWVEGGDPGNVDLRGSQDRHLIIVDADHKYLYELYNVFYSATEGQWHAGSGAFFDMNTNTRRPYGWTSADAAGLAILPGLVRYDEVYDPAIPDIKHAFRVTVRATDGFVDPASHEAGSTLGALPMGARLRLKASVDVTQRSSNPNMQKIFRALQRYGLIVADNGSDLYITGTYDTRWDNGILNPAFGALTANDFEVTVLGYTPPSGPSVLQAVAVQPTSVTGGQSSSGTVTLSGPAPTSGLVVNLAANQPCVSVPASVTVAAGATTASFVVTTIAVSTAVDAQVTATAGTVTANAILHVTPPALASLTLNPTAVDGGSSSIGTVTLSGPAGTGGATVALASSKTTAAVPAAVSVAAGQRTATFTITTTSVNANTSAVISASYGGVSKSVTLSIRKKKR